MQRILVASDWSEGAARAVQRAARLAGEQNADLHLFHVMAGAADSPDAAATRAKLETLAETLAREHPCIRTLSSGIGFGRPADAILAEAAARGAELIVLGLHERASWFEDLFGITAERMLRKAPVPVLIVHDAPRGPYRKVLAAVDADSATDELALACALSSAESVHAVHAFHVPFEGFLPGEETRAHVRAEELAGLEGEVRQVLGGFPHRTLEVHADVREGEVLAVLADAWRELEPDLLVIGTHGRSGLSLALHGSFAAAVIETLKCDTLVGRRSGS